LLQVSVDVPQKRSFLFLRGVDRQHHHALDEDLDLPNVVNENPFDHPPALHQRLT
jgi:hypothetical protein